MLKFSNKDKKSKMVYVVAIIVVILVIILVSSLSKGKKSGITGVVNLVNNIVASVSEKTSNITGFFESKKKLNMEIENLKKENDQLKLNNVEMKKIENENNSLRKKLEIKEEYKYFKMISGAVIVRNQSNWQESFIIDVGSKDGIKEGMPVITKDGLVGQTVSVTEDTSKVMTILDPSSSVSVEIGSISQTAVCKGEYSLKGKSELKLIYIPIDAEISPGDIVYSSGISEIYPKGLPVGKIVEVKNNKNEINRYAIVETFSNILTVNEIAVILE